MSSMHLDFFQNVQPKAGTATTQVDPNAAQQQGAQGQGAPPMGGCAGGGMSWIMFLAIIPMLFLMFRRQKKEQEARGKLKEGDKVVSNAGIIGTLVSPPTQPIVKVKIAPGTTIEMLSQNISPFDPAAAVATAASKPAAKDKDDKKASAAELAASKPVTDKK